MSLNRLVAMSITVVVLTACGGGGLSGTYQAQQPDGTMTLEFRGGGKVFMTMQEQGGQPDTSTAEYVAEGNNVTIQGKGGIPLVLVRDGNALTASMMGETLRFEKK